jgi:hypothetical protein
MVAKLVGLEAEVAAALDQGEVHQRPDVALLAGD